MNIFIKIPYAFSDNVYSFIVCCILIKRCFRDRKRVWPSAPFLLRTPHVVMLEHCPRCTKMCFQKLHKQWNKVLLSTLYKRVFRDMINFQFRTVELPDNHSHCFIIVIKVIFFKQTNQFTFDYRAFIKCSVWR